MGILDIRQVFFRNSKNFLESKAHQAIPSEELPYNFAIKEIFARYVYICKCDTPVKLIVLSHLIVVQRMAVPLSHLLSRVQTDLNSTLQKTLFQESMNTLYNTTSLLHTIFNL